MEAIEIRQLCQKSYGQEYLACPACSGERKKSKSKCLSVNHDKGVYNCHHCGESGLLKPKANNTTRGDYLTGRGFNIPMLESMGVTDDGYKITMPYYRDGKEVNAKFRKIGEKHYQFIKTWGNCGPILYNYDCISDATELIITEGEIDALTFIACGYQNTVSVPTGAKKSDGYFTDIDLTNINTFYIAADDDAAGHEMRQKLSRYFAPTTCKIVTYNGKKDVNDLFKSKGKQAVIDAIESASIIDENKWAADNQSVNGLSANGGTKIEFWGMPANGKFYFFNKFDLCTYLKSIGIYRYYTPNTKYILVRIQDNVVDFIDVATIKHLVIDYVDSQNDDWLLDCLQMNINKLVNDVNMDLLSRNDIEFFQGEKDKIYIFYKDKIAVVDSANTSEMDYKDFHGIIWSSVIMDRNYPDKSQVNFNKGVFEKFFNNVFNNTANREYVKHVFGYALQRYRNLSNMRAIILNDDNIDDQAKGGTGKGLLYQAFKQYMTGVKENGKAYRATMQFSFQNLNLDTRLCFLDDVPPKFDITQLFSVITDGLFIEKKNHHPLWIDATNAPLFLISSNYGVSGSDDSHLRRRFDIGLDKYYSSKFTPEDDFKHQLFREWDTKSQEWIKFDLFMLECARMFLKDGVKIWENPNLETKQFRADTHEDFLEYAEGIDSNKDISKPDTLTELRKLTEIKNLSQSRVTRWIKKYAEYKNLNYEDDRKKKTFKLSEGTELHI